MGIKAIWPISSLLMHTALPPASPTCHHDSPLFLLCLCSPLICAPSSSVPARSPLFACLCSPLICAAPPHPAALSSPSFGSKTLVLVEGELLGEGAFSKVCKVTGARGRAEAIQDSWYKIRRF